MGESLSLAPAPAPEAYGRSKLCNILFSKALAEKFPLAETNISFNAVHPGLVDTKLLNVAPGKNSLDIAPFGSEGVLHSD